MNELSTPPDFSAVHRIALIDDHPLIRIGIAAVIDAQADLQVVGEAGSIAAAIELVRSIEPELVIVDLSFEDGHGLELIRRLRARPKPPKILVCSMHDEAIFATRALDAGANGYIGKGQAARHLVDAVRRVLGGQTWLSEPMTARVLKAVARGRPRSNSDIAARLTDREIAIFELIGRGMGPSRIAEQLHLSVKTIEAHREKIKRKLNLASGGELLRAAVQWVIEQC